MASLMRGLPILLTVLVALTAMVSSSPIPATSPNPNTLLGRMSAAIFADFPVNVIFLGGANQFGGWVPTDGSFHSTSDILCLDEPAGTTGACGIPTVDFIGVATGSGPCSFVGTNGFSATMQGNAGDGWYTVGPPQQIIMVACGSAS